MNPFSRLPAPSPRKILVAALGTLLVGVGSGVGIYLDSRAHPPLQQATRTVKSAPTPAPVGAVSAAQPQQAVLLTVVGTTPDNLASAIAPSTSIALLFNLAVNPKAVKGALSVRSYDVNVVGTVSQGKTAQQVVFKPGSAFSYGASVVVTLRSGLRSVDGADLNNDYSFSFTTLAGPGSVNFFDSGRVARLVNSPAGRPVTLVIEMGGGVPASVAIKTYRATAKDMLAGLIYSNSTDGFPVYANKPIATESMRLVDNGGTTLSASGARTTAVQTGVEVTISQPAGIYAIVAADPHGQYGVVWVDFSPYGIIVRQDDQKVVMAGEDLRTDETTPKFNVTFYNLLNGVHPKISGSFSGTGEFAARYPAGLDIAIVTSGTDEVAVPMGAPESGADVRVSTDLSLQPQIFLTTDRPAYQKGETVKFGGVTRLSNDQVYTVGGGGKVTVWTTVSGTLAVAKVAADGTFSGSFKLPTAEFATNGGDAWVALYANASATGPFDSNALTSSTSIIAVAPNSATNSLAVTLDKASYFAGDTIVASITGVNASTQPLAGQTVSVGLYATQYPWTPVEMDSLRGPTEWGDRIAAFVKVRLDATGHATFRTTPNVGLKATDQNITVVAVIGTGRSQAYTARTATFYQADEEVYMPPARSSFQPGDAVLGPFVVETRTGARVGGRQLAYELVRTDYEGDKAITTVVANGTAITNSMGFGYVRALYTGSPASLVLRVKGKDQSGRVYQDAKDITVGATWDGNPQLDVTTETIASKVGETPTLNVSSPDKMKVLLSLERGRVHQYGWVQLGKGNNSIGVSISPDLAPGFHVVFSYFHNGVYGSQDLPIFINNSDKLLKVTVTPDHETYAKGEIAHLDIAVTDSAGAPVAASLLAGAYEARMSSNLIEDQPSIATAFLTPNRLGTNASSSLVSIGTWGDGVCGGGPPSNPQFASGMYPGRSNVWLTDIATDSSGHATINVPMSLQGPVKLVLVASTPGSSWGQAETVLALK